jgi:hypothetical protein
MFEYLEPYKLEEKDFPIKELLISDLKDENIICYYDGPLLFHKDNYLYYLVTYDSSICWFFIIDITENELNLLMNGKVDLYSTLNKDISYLIKVMQMGNIDITYKCSIDQIGRNHFAENGVYFGKDKLNE